MEENSLRLILLGVGVTILVGIYFYDVLQKKVRRRANESDSFTAGESVESVMSNGTPFSAVYEEAAINDAAPQAEHDSVKGPVELPESAKEDVPVAQQALVIQLTVLPKGGSSFSGTALLDAFSALNLEFGDMGIFHCYERHDGVEVKRFHVANILEPGTFPVGSMDDFESTGVVLFFQANDSVNPELAFESMLTLAKQLSERFDAILAAGDMQELSVSGISDIQSQLAGLSRL